MGSQDIRRGCDNQVRAVYIDGLVQHFSNSSASAIELLQFCSLH